MKTKIMNAAIESFFIEFKEELKQIEFILRYLHTYPEILEQLGIGDIITGDELLEHHEEWLRLYYKLDTAEREFHKPFWIPITTDSYEYYIDASDKNFPVLETAFFPSGWSRINLFDSISDFMLLHDNKVDLAEIKRDQIERLINQFEVNSNENKGTSV